MTDSLPVAQEPLSFLAIFATILFMDPQEKQMLRETLDLVGHNNKMLRSMRRSMQWSRVFHIIYWIVILGVTVAGYYYAQPYIDQLIKITSMFKGDLSNVGKLINSGSH